MTAIFQHSQCYYQKVGNNLVCKENEKCEFEDDLKGCALKHIGKARELIAKGKGEDADVELSYAAKHLKEK